MEKLPEAGTSVKIIGAPDFFKHYIGIKGNVGRKGTSGETVAVSVAVGYELYFTKEQLEQA